MDGDGRVIVIGSGPSGAIAALSLVRQGIPVTMLESGEGFPGGLLVRAMGRNIFRRRPSFGDPRRHTSSTDPAALWYHALVPGGMSNYWTGAVPRFAPEDFSEGARLDERYRWPVTYADLAPYYERAERLIGVVADPRPVYALPPSCASYRHRLPSDWQWVARRAAGFGQGLTPIPLADGPPWLITRSGAAFNSFTRLIPALRRSSLFSLRLGAHALRLEWSNVERRVSGVTYYDRATQSERHISAAAVVLAAGPLASPKLLLDSATPDFPHGLGNTDGVLGRYLHDHALDTCVVELDRPLSRLSHAAYLTRSPYEESEPLRAAQCALGSVSTRDKLLSVGPMKARAFGVVIFGTMVPVQSNQVRLHPRLKDEFGLPKLDLHITFDDGVTQTMASARERLLAILESAGNRATIHTPSPVLVPGTSVHYGGAVRMHASPRYGMLDSWNRLHAVANVAVVDASSFTTGVEKNPTLTAMALAARAADRLAADLMAPC